MSDEKHISKVGHVDSEAASGIQKAFKKAEEDIKNLPIHKPASKQKLETEQAEQLQQELAIRSLTAEQINEYQSASDLMRSISEEAIRWRDNLPPKYRPAILAVLQGGIQIEVHSLSQISFHGIRIAGTMNGSPCAMFAHQTSVQLLCFAEEIVEQAPKNPIGFIWPGNSVEV